jgi:hypothetical protein
MKPAAPMPTASTSWPSRSSCTHAAMTSSTSLGLAEGVGRRVLARTWPCSSTTPAATFVPPTSTPMVSTG